MRYGSEIPTSLIGNIGQAKENPVDYFTGSYKETSRIGTSGTGFSKLIKKVLRPSTKLPFNLFLPRYSPFN
jgi:hypothetical protein